MILKKIYRNAYIVEDDMEECRSTAVIEPTIIAILKEG